MAFFGKFNPTELQQRVVSHKPSNELERRKRPSNETLTVKEVAKHNTRSDCWVIVDGKAYDVTSWVDKHPGGDHLLLSHAGMDATDIFDAFHDPNSYKILKAFYIGDVSDVVVPETTKAHRLLRKKLEEDNLYEANYLYYVFKFVSTVSLVAASVFVVSYFSSSWRILIGGILMGLFWQQCGWLSHDFLHHQVFKNRSYNNAVGYLVGNVFQGFSVSWWKAKHNLHHATVNIAGFDPDIDTLPFLAWSEKLIEGELEGLPQFLVKYQHILYFPLLSAARLSWMIQSFIYAESKSLPSKRTTEIVTLFAHYFWYLAVLFLCMTWKEAPLFVLVSQASTGIFLATAFSLGHNGMVIYEKGTQASMEFNRLQVTTGRDVSGPAFVCWFMGGLDKQIEHHLYPRVPRHNLGIVRSLVVPLCAKTGIPYHVTGFWAGTKETIARLYSVSILQVNKLFKL